MGGNKNVGLTEASPRTHAIIKKKTMNVLLENLLKKLVIIINILIKGGFQNSN
jgi:hypothetical protein